MSLNIPTGTQDSSSSSVPVVPVVPSTNALRHEDGFEEEESEEDGA